MDLIIHLTLVAAYAYSFLDIRFWFKVSVSFYTETVRTESESGNSFPQVNVMHLQ